jgi:hypothetical protein
LFFFLKRSTRPDCCCCCCCWRTNDKTYDKRREHAKRPRGIITYTCCLPPSSRCASVWSIATKKKEKKSEIIFVQRPVDRSASINYWPLLVATTNKLRPLVPTVYVFAGW